MYMESKITNYNTITFEKNRIIIIIDNNKLIWFNAKQISSALKYKEPKKAIKKYVEKADKIQLKNININFKVYQQPDSLYINLSRINKNKKYIFFIFINVFFYIDIFS
jgi:prophage antirepressor-like protein